MFAKVKYYTPQSKTQIKNILEYNLGPKGLAHYSENLMLCLDELVKNGHKANYKFCLVMNNIETALRAKGQLKLMSEIQQQKRLFNEYALRYGCLTEVSGVVRKALSQEAKIIDLKTKAIAQGRRYRLLEAELRFEIPELFLVRGLMRKYGINVHLRFDTIGDSLELEVINNAPILDSDLQRIENRRRLFKDFADSGNEICFFTDHMDSSEAGAGLGYATIDSILRDLGMDPFEAITIVSVTNTAVLISIKLDTLKQLAVETRQALQ